MQSNWSNFKLHPDLLKALELLEFHTPSEVQERVLPFSRYNNDLIIAAKTVSSNLRVNIYVQGIRENAVFSSADFIKDFL